MIHYHIKSRMTGFGIAGLLLMAQLTSSEAQAGSCLSDCNIRRTISCEASYAVGIGQVYKGDASAPMSLVKGVVEGKHHRIVIANEGKGSSVSVTDKATQKSQTLVLHSLTDTTWVAFTQVQNFPDDIPGKRFSPIVYLFVLCSASSAS